jgi:hypothetical protein
MIIAIEISIEFEMRSNFRDSGFEQDRASNGALLSMG